MQKKQSIVWLSSSYPRFEKDSASIFLRYLAETIDSTEYDVHVLSPDDYHVDHKQHSKTIFLHYFKYFMPRRLQKLAYGSGILPNLKANRLLYIQIPFFLVSQLIACYRLVKKLQPALIHAHWAFPQGTIASIVGRLTNTPVIITTHGGDAFALQGSVLAAIKHWSLKHCSAWTSNTSATANAFWGDIGKPYIIPMGIDYQQFSTGNGETLRASVTKDSLVLLFVGRLVEKKGVKDLLRAYSLLSCAQHQQTQLWIIGDGSERRSLEKLTHSLQLTDYVTFLGKLPNEQLPDYFASADIFIAPSITDSVGDTEGQGITLVEAMASSTAVVSTNTGGICEVIEHDHTGLIVAPESPPELKVALQQLIENKALREKMAKKGGLAAKKYSWVQVGVNFQQLYSKVCLDFKTKQKH